MCAALPRRVGVAVRGAGRSQTIDISDYVDLGDIEPVYFDRTYYIAPRGKEYTKVYELLRAALAEAGKAGIATFVMRGKQYLTALRAEDKLLVLQTLHWADEVRDPGQEPPELPSGRAGKGEERDMAIQLIDALDSACGARDEAHVRVMELRERLGPPATEPWSEAQTTTYETAWRAWQDLERDLQEAITQYAKNEGLDRNDIEQAVRSA